MKQYKIAPTNRSGVWYLIRRVPAALKPYDNRTFVKISTGIKVEDDPRGTRAAPAIQKLNDQLEAYWRALASGQDPDAGERYKSAQKLARVLGFSYAPASDLLAGPPAEIVRRVNAIKSPEKPSSAPAVAALLGGEEPQALRLSGLLDQIEAHERASMVDMSEKQVHKWRLPKARAINYLTTLIGDKALTEITRDDALDFRDWWQTRITEEGLQKGTANRDIDNLNKMVRTIFQRDRIDQDVPFAGTRISGGYTGQRTAFLPKFVQDEILKEGVFDDLNEEARRVVYLIAETGLRLSEACNLTRETIILDAEVPHIIALPDGRRMKTRQSQREIPLVGVALEAMKLSPNGFPRYREKADTLSALMSKAFKARKFNLTEKHSLYSLRHTFEDRLIAVETPEKVVANLMGHAYSRPRYGLGPSLAQKHKWLSDIAFRAPSRL